MPHIHKFWRIRHFAASICALLLTAGLMTSTKAAENIDPGGTGEQFAWGENIGWINAEPSGEGGPGIEVLDNKLTGHLWSENAGWISLSCENRGTCGARSYGVTNDGTGKLGGYGWGENIGWISFSCDNRGTCNEAGYGVSIDGVTGIFSGEAWSENAGWINFGSSSTPASYAIKTAWQPGSGSCTPAPDPDLNNDTVVNILDVSMVGGCFNKDPTTIAICEIADTNCDNAVNMTDLMFVFGSYGQGGF